jgi:hypothetical protein
MGAEDMIEIAGGIVLAILFLALLSAIIVAAYWAVAFGVILIGAIAIAWFVWAGAQSSEGLALELIAAGVFLVWLGYEVKARREIAAERDAAPGDPQ